MFVFLNMYPINQPEVTVADAVHRFDAQGSLIHDQTRQFIADLLKSLAAWTAKLKG
jgi:chromate reductase, NAD(P)H dehydrogenase (quinone)